jgi:SAM-dependent methyltransferase
MIEQHPLAFLLGIEGVALLRAFAGEHDAAFTEARFAEVRRLLEMTDEPFVALEPLPTAEAYDGWADSYDEPGNELVEIEQRVVWEILETLPAGVALDAACGTGRHAARLAQLGHTVIGVDGSPGMLQVARAKIPSGEFHQGDLNALPLPDGHVDLVVCGLALMHVRDLDPVFAEFVRVLRPGGAIVVSDRARLQDAAGAPIVKRTPAGRVGYVPEWNHTTGEYVRTALRHELRIVACEEPVRPSPMLRDPNPPEHVPGEPANPWALLPKIREAANAAHHRRPIAIVWHFQTG